MTKESANLAYVDQLRGLAVLMVILVHASQRVNGLSDAVASIARCGQLGVQLFFIASAYTLCASFDRRKSEPSPIVSFYVRRFFRIAPLYYIGILTYFLVFVYFEYQEHGAIVSFGPYVTPNVIANILFVHGLVPQANNNIVPGGWSIGTEMLFYLVFPLVFYVGTLLVKKWRLAGAVILLLFVTATNIAIQFLLRETALSIDINNFSYFSIFNQLPVFVTGLVTYFYVKQTTPRDRHVTMILSGVSFCFFTVLTAALWRLNLGFLFTIVPLSAGVAFAFLLNYSRVANHDLQLLQRIGSASYSIYIFHFLFAWHMVPFITAPLVGRLGGNWILALSFFLSAAMSFGCAIVTERAIEARGISIGAKLVKWIQAKATPTRSR